MEAPATRFQKASAADAKSCLAVRFLVHAALIIVLLLPGCGSFKTYHQVYSGPERNPSEIAIISAKYWQSYWVFGSANLKIDSIDGWPVNWLTAHIEPGEHDVGFEYDKSAFCGNFGACIYEDKVYGSIHFTAQKGHRYKLDVDKMDGELWARISDEASGQNVTPEVLIDQNSDD